MTDALPLFRLIDSLVADGLVHINLRRSPVPWEGRDFRARPEEGGQRTLEVWHAADGWVVAGTASREFKAQSDTALV